MTKTKIFYQFIILFLAAEATLGTLFQISDIDGHYIFGFLLVLLACLFCFLFFGKEKRYICTQTGLVFSVFADYLLVILGDFYLYGVILFFIAQTAYMLRIIFDTDSRLLKNIHIYVRIFSSIVAFAIPFIILKENTDALSVVSVVYYVNLILNTVFAFISLKNDRRGILFAFGLLFFAFCDLFVGLGNITAYFDISNDSLLFNIIYGKINTAWLFYAPSQALIGISLFPYKK